MITCKDCYLYDGCIAGHLHCYDEEGIKKNCESFKNKNNYVEVVRCKDCSEWDSHKPDDAEYKYGRCSLHDAEMERNDFCSYGKRRKLI